MTNKPSSAPAPSEEKAQSKASNNCACQLLSACDRDEPGLLITDFDHPDGNRASPASATSAFAACLGISDAASAAATTIPLHYLRHGDHSLALRGDRLAVD